MLFRNFSQMKLGILHFSILRNLPFERMERKVILHLKISLQKNNDDDENDVNNLFFKKNCC
jgi:hypothetical protein